MGVMVATSVVLLVAVAFMVSATASVVVGLTWLLARRLERAIALRRMSRELSADHRARPHVHAADERRRVPRVANVFDTQSDPAHQHDRGAWLQAEVDCRRAPRL
jgi:ABC-type transport system involved in cytochrome c biogenesis permease subunit